MSCARALTGLPGCMAMSTTDASKTARLRVRRLTARAKSGDRSQAISRNIKGKTRSASRTSEILSNRPVGNYLAASLDQLNSN